MQRAGERATDLARAFNALEGLTSEDDRTATRFTTSFDSGPRKGVQIDIEDLEKAKQDYYQKMDWEPKSATPTRAKLEELGIGWVAEKLARYGKLPSKA